MSVTSIILTELFGTMLLVMFGCGVAANLTLKGNAAKGAGFMVGAMGWGIGLAVAVLISISLKGVAYLNPAVAIGSAIEHAKSSDYSWGFSNATLNGFSGVGLFFIVIAVEVVGAILGQIIVNVVYFQQIKKALESGNEEDKFDVLSIHVTNSKKEKSYIFSLIAEIVGTFILVAGILGLVKLSGNGGNSDLANAMFISGGIALILTVDAFAFSGITGLAANPARDLGPRIVHQLFPFGNKKASSDWKYSWVPVLGGIIGGSIAGALFLAAF